MSQPQRIHNSFGSHNVYIDYTHLNDKTTFHFLPENVADPHVFSFNLILNCRINAIYVILMKSYNKMAVFLSPFSGQSDKPVAMGRGHAVALYISNRRALKICS
jgi:hypothetical protein